MKSSSLNLTSDNVDMKSDIAIAKDESQLLILRLIIQDLNALFLLEHYDGKFKNNQDLIIL